MVKKIIMILCFFITFCFTYGQVKIKYYSEQTEKEKKKWDAKKYKNVFVYDTIYTKNFDYIDYKGEVQEMAFGKRFVAYQRSYLNNSMFFIGEHLKTDTVFKKNDFMIFDSKRTKIYDDSLKAKITIVTNYTSQELFILVAPKIDTFFCYFPKPLEYLYYYSAYSSRDTLDIERKASFKLYALNEPNLQSNKNDSALNIRILYENEGIIYVDNIQIKGEIIQLRRKQGSFDRNMYFNITFNDSIFLKKQDVQKILTITNNTAWNKIPPFCSREGTYQSIATIEISGQSQYHAWALGNACMKEDTMRPLYLLLERLRTLSSVYFRQKNFILY